MTPIDILVDWRDLYPREKRYMTRICLEISYSVARLSSNETQNKYFKRFVDAVVYKQNKFLTLGQIRKQILIGDTIKGHFSLYKRYVENFSQGILDFLQDPALLSSYVILTSASSNKQTSKYTPDEIAKIKDIVYDTIGNSTDKPQIFLHKKHRNSLVRGLAERAYKEGTEKGYISWERRSILADAIEESGCPGTNPLVVHLRDCRYHGQGCWAVKAVL